MRRLTSVLLLSLAPVLVNADDVFRADSHAPIGVMGDHYHAKGEWMFSYRYMYMDMDGNRDGTDDIDPDTIATTARNPFFGLPMQPPTLRVVPTQMSMEMHMFGLMYAPSDWLTLMVMANYIEKEMDHITFRGGMGTARLGTFTTETDGLGDTRVAGLIRLSEGHDYTLHGTVGVSLPTGDTEETGQILTPMGGRPSPRLPYPMQLGSGTYDAILGLTYTRYFDRWSWGSQWNSIIRTGEDNGYTLGDEHRLSTWLAYLWSPSLSLSARLEGFDRDNIDGRDPLITAPVQTADPNRQGATRVDFLLGANYAFPGTGHRLAIEGGVPVYQDLDGPQLETDYLLTVGYQFAF